MIKYKDKSGVLLVVVLIIVMVMMVLSVTIVSQSMSQSRGSRYQADQIVAEQWAKGVFWQQYSAGNFSATTQQFNLNNHTYTCTTNPNSLPQVTVSCSY